MPITVSHHSQEEGARAARAAKSQVSELSKASELAALELEQARSEAEERRLQVAVLLQTVETLQVRRCGPACILVMPLKQLRCCCRQWRRCR